MHTAESYIAALAEKQNYNDRFCKLQFELKEPSRLMFEAGQYVSIKIPGEEVGDQEAGAPDQEPNYRNYFIFSSTEIDHGFEILLDRNVGGQGLTYLDGLIFGQEIELTAPHGLFGENLHEPTEFVFVAEGVGVAPFYSMLQDLLQVNNDQRKITLFWGLEDTTNFFLGDELSQIAENFANFNFHPVIAKAPPEWSLCRGDVLDCIDVHEINKEAHFYICADEGSAETIKNAILEKGVDQINIKVANY